MNFSQNKKKWHFWRAMAFLCFFVKSFPFFFNLVISVWNLKKLRYSVKRCSSCSKRHRTFWPEAHFGGNLFFQPLLHESIFLPESKKYWEENGSWPPTSCWLETCKSQWKVQNIHFNLYCQYYWCETTLLLNRCCFCSTLHVFSICQFV